MPANRTKTGQFAKGTSGNPAGRPKRSDAEAETLAAIYTLAPAAVEVLRSILEDDITAPASVRLKCAEIVFNRICGKPMDLEGIERIEDTPRWDFSPLEDAE